MVALLYCQQCLLTEIHAPAGMRINLALARDKQTLASLCPTVCILFTSSINLLNVTLTAIAIDSFTTINRVSRIEQTNS